jgi:1-acyl-sn-glycerol-3-phosphate acyltransferase
MIPTMIPALRLLFVLLVAYPIVWGWLGLAIQGAERLPRQGPAILVANHNSHIDILVLLTLLSWPAMLAARPAAAADYFLRNRALAWLATRVIGILPVARGTAGRHHDPLAGCREALAAGQILILFPEGTRGDPERLSQLKSGLWYLGRDFPTVPIVPIFLHGLGRSLAKGQWIPLPIFVDVLVDLPLPWDADRHAFKEALAGRFLALQAHATRPLY